MMKLPKKLTQLSFDVDHDLLHSTHQLKIYVHELEKLISELPTELATLKAENARMRQCIREGVAILDERAAAHANPSIHEAEVLVVLVPRTKRNLDEARAILAGKDVGDE